MGLLDIFRISKIKQENEQLKAANIEMQNKIASLGVNEYYETQKKIELITKESDDKLAATSREIASNNTIMSDLRE